MPVIPRTVCDINVSESENIDGIKKCQSVAEIADVLLVQSVICEIAQGTAVCTFIDSHKCQRTSKQANACV